MLRVATNTAAVPSVPHVHTKRHLRASCLAVRLAARRDLFRARSQLVLAFLPRISSSDVALAPSAAAASAARFQRNRRSSRTHGGRNQIAAPGISLASLAASRILRGQVCRRGRGVKKNNETPESAAAAFLVAACRLRCVDNLYARALAAVTKRTGQNEKESAPT